MIKKYCTNNNHTYGQFKENKNNYYRICEICHKKTIYPKTNEIKNEIEKQVTAKKLLEIITKQKINIIKTNNNFIKLIACLLDNLSYLYLDDNKIEDILKKITSINNYFNQNQESYQLINNTVNYLNQYFYNPNTEEELSKLDIIHNELVERFNYQILKQIENEENNTIEIENNQIDLKNSSNNSLELLEETN